MVRTYQEKEEEEAAVKDRGSGTITGDPTPTGSPGPRTWSSSWVLWGLFRKHKQPCTFFFFLSMRCLYLSVLMSTNMLWQPEAKQFPMKKNLITNIHFAVGLRDSSSEATRRDQIKPLQGESWDKHMYCAPLMYCSLLRRLIFLHFKSSHHYILPAALKYYIMSLTLMAVFDPDLICNAIPASLIKSEPFAL